MYSPQALACTREPGLPIFLPQWQEKRLGRRKRVCRTWGDTEEFKQRFMKWEAGGGCPATARAARGVWHTWLSLRPAAIGPSQVPFLAQVFISEWTALNVQTFQFWAKTDTLFLHEGSYKASTDIWGRGVLCDLENLGTVTLRTLSRFCSLQGGAVPDHRLGGLVSASPASPGPLQSGLVSWVEIIALQAQLWPKIMILWQWPQLGGGRHCLLEQKWASSLSLCLAFS